MRYYRCSTTDHVVTCTAWRTPSNIPQILVVVVPVATVSHFGVLREVEYVGLDFHFVLSTYTVLDPSNQDNNNNITSKMKSHILNSPSLIEYKGVKFLIFDAPTDVTLDNYIKVFKKNNLKYIVRACDPSYSTDKLTQENIEVLEMPFPDGGTPSDAVITQWTTLVRTVYKDEGCHIGVHCVAGLGRAPVLVAIALMELGASYTDAVDLIREKRKGAINAKQLRFLKSYTPKKKGGCNIM
ncbi:protein tyrosine phosphatase type IVA 3-like [Planoprotostelium fungivorum]|uniref:protein-tyrosine-phosphatase n=1 Tax=Planoprotostelium fungivorum TaxID=1890364 RepID=A0A2P6MYB0_9EUKA|nr:protein tyrosine phosphatase type IVA 3-like [Planoprotostelium fungivorum]